MFSTPKVIELGVQQGGLQAFVFNKSLQATLFELGNENVNEQKHLL